jgi:hypothetical protein
MKQMEEMMKGMGGMPGMSAGAGATSSSVDLD